MNKVTNLTNYRMYCWGNMYLSPIQQGIQAAHAITDMFIEHSVEYIEPVVKSKLYAWGEIDKTIILLNGGNCRSLREIYLNVSKFADRLHLPFGAFREDTESLNNALTCVSLVVPNTIYDLCKSETLKIEEVRLDFDNLDRWYDENAIEKSWYDLHLSRYLKTFKLAA